MVFTGGFFHPGFVWRFFVKRIQVLHGRVERSLFLVGLYGRVYGLYGFHSFLVFLIQVLRRGGKDGYGFEPCWDWSMFFCDKKHIFHSSGRME